MSDTKSILYSEFRCRLAANGGWLLEHDSGGGRMANIIGAFTSSADLIEHLSRHVYESGLEEVVKVPPVFQKGGAA